MVQKASPPFPIIVRFRATARDVRLLGKLAKEYQRTPSWVLRRLIEDGARAAGLLKPKTVIESKAEEV
jgi:hypothetical protein